MNKYKLYAVTYTFKTANGAEHTDRICHIKREEADQICAKIDALEGFTLIAVNVEFDGREI